MEHDLDPSTAALGLCRTYPVRTLFRRANSFANKHARFDRAFEARSCVCTTSSTAQRPISKIRSVLLATTVATIQPHWEAILRTLSTVPRPQPEITAFIEQTTSHISLQKPHLRISTMFPPCFLLLLLFSSLLTLSAAALPPAPLTPLSRPLTITTPNGTSLSILQSIRIPNFGIANVWPKGGRPPTWLRPVDPAGTNILLDLTIATYATRPSDGIAGYGTIGPESSTLLKGIEERVVVKQWVNPSMNRSRIPVAPVRNRDVAYAAEM